MSLILEALRKSEAERRRGQAPDLAAELPPPAPRARAPVPAWTWLVAGTLVLGLAAWLWRAPPPGPMPPEHGNSASPVVPATDPAPMVAGGSDADTTSAVAPAFPPVERIAPPPQPLANDIDPHREADAPVVRPPPAQASAPVPAAPPGVPAGRATATATSTAAATEARAPTVAELAAEERRQLPPLKLSMHMWDERPSQRFVILDGTRYGEGDRVGSAVVAAIEPDGVRFELNGRAVRLPLR